MRHVEKLTIQRWELLMGVALTIATKGRLINDMCLTVQYNEKVDKYPNVEDYAFLFDIDNNGLDSHVFNTVLRKNSWKQFTDILQDNCADFSA